VIKFELARAITKISKNWGNSQKTTLEFNWTVYLYKSCNVCILCLRVFVQIGGGWL